MTQPHALPVVAEETAASTESTPVNGFHLEPRCHVCRNDRLREQVNDLLARGASYAYIVRALEDDAKVDNSDRVTIDSIRNHSARHFPVQTVARATYREILERRAKENGVDFVEGVATAITPMAFLETIMVKGYETLVDPDTEVDLKTAMIAAGRLQALLDSRAGQPDIVDIMVKQNRIIAAVQSMLPESSWPELMRRVDGTVKSADRVDDEIEEFDPGDDDEYDPLKLAEIEDDDDF